LKISASTSLELVLVGYRGKILYLLGKFDYFYSSMSATLNITSFVDSNNTLQLIKSTKKPNSFFSIIKLETGETDEKISGWLGIDVKTYRGLKLSKKQNVRSSLVEQAIMLISLFRHGKDIFGTTEQFNKWLEKANFYFGKKAPVTFIDTISGIKFIDDRLTALEYGDNA
jgi:uncharacterized protein (DUF2384 family)